jgi:hypothetical protein
MAVAAAIGSIVSTAQRAVEGGNNNSRRHKLVTAPKGPIEGPVIREFSVVKTSKTAWSRDPIPEKNQQEFWD